jgi:hypothetical protein
MNTFIIQKCLDELNTPQPNISYIKGILETLIVMSGANITTPIIPKVIPVVGSSVSSSIIDDEVDEVLKKYESGKTGKLTQI